MKGHRHSILVSRSVTMRALPAGKMLCLSTMTLIALIVANGCQSTTSLSGPIGPDFSRSSNEQLTAAGMMFEGVNPKHMLVRPGMEIAWTLKAPGSDRLAVVYH